MAEERAEVRQVNAVFLSHLLEMSKYLYFNYVNGNHEGVVKTAVYLAGLISKFVEDEDINYIFNKVNEYRSVKASTYEKEEYLKQGIATEIYDYLSQLIGAVSSFLGVKVRESKVIQA